MSNLPHRIAERLYENYPKDGVTARLIEDISAVISQELQQDKTLTRLRELAELFVGSPHVLDNYPLQFSKGLEKTLDEFAKEIDV